MNKIQLDFWNVGQGDASTITLPDGSLCVIDVGPANSSLSRWFSDSKRNIPDIKYLILTHNDADHVGGLQCILQAPNVRIEKVRLLAEATKNGNNRAVTLIEKLYGKVGQEKIGSLVRQEEPLTLGSWNNYTLKVYFPNFVENLINHSPNTTSAILALCYEDNVCVIWGADNYLKTIDEHIPGEGDSEMLFGPHHGAPLDFEKEEQKNAIGNLKPKRCFISAGNGYKHPNIDYIKILAGIKCQAMCSRLSTHCREKGNLKKAVHDSAGYYSIPLSTNDCSLQCCGHIRFYLEDGVLVFDEDSQGHAERLEKFKCQFPCQIDQCCN